MLANHREHAARGGEDAMKSINRIAAGVGWIIVIEWILGALGFGKFVLSFVWGG